MNILIAAGNHLIEAGTLLEVLSSAGHTVQHEFSSASSTFHPDLVVCYDSSIRYPNVPVVQVWSPYSIIESVDLVVFPGKSSISAAFRGRQTIIPQAVDTGKFRPVLHERERLILSLGRLDPEKGHKTLIQAITLINPGVTAVIAGREAFFTPEKIFEYAASLGVESRVQIVTESEKVFSLLGRASVGVVTSLGNQTGSYSGRKIMASGLPFLAASTEDLCNLITDGVTGLLHSPGNWKQLAGQINHLMDNAGLAEMLGSNARRYCKKHLSFKSVGNRWTEVLEQLSSG